MSGRASGMRRFEASRRGGRAIRSRGFRAVRMGAYIERVQAQALLAAGQTDAARQVAGQALAQSLLYDAPGAASIAQARDLVSRAGGAR